MNKTKFFLILCLAMALNQIQLKAQTYATLPFAENFENAWVNKNGTRDVPSVYWINTPATGSSSWSRDDDGVARGAWTGSNFWPNSTAAANGSAHSASFPSGEAFNSGTLDLYVNFGTLTGSKALYFWYINTSGDDKFEVSVSTDGGTTFGSPLVTLYNKNEWSKVTLDLGDLTSSTGVVRFKGIYVLNHSSPISIDDIYIGTHSTTPIVADFSTDRVSGISPLTVNFTDKSTGDVTNWSWDFNNDGTIDATTQNPTYTFTTGTFTTKLISYKPGVSASKTTTITTTPQIYGTLPFIEDFDHTWVNREGTGDVPSLSFKNTPSIGINSWCRNDGVSSKSYEPDGAENSQYSARFRSSMSSYSGTLDAFIDFSTQTGNKTLSFWYINPSGNDKLEIYLSTDGGATFGSALLTLAIQKSWEKVTYDLGNINSSTGVIRFKTQVEYDDRYNGSDLGIDNIRVSNPTGIPIDAYFTSDKTSGQSPLTVNFTDKSGGAPTSWKWDFNNDGVIDATTQNPSYTYSVPGVYTVKLTVANSNYSEEGTRSNYIVVPGYAGLPYNQTFENDWVNRDNTRDVPDNFWKGTPATGNNSWSREDDGEYRGAWNSSNSTYNPSGANGSLHSACFNSYYVYNGTGSIDLYVNFSSQTGEKRLAFWYINRGGNDKLEVFLSTNGGSTFGAALVTLSVSYTWTKVYVSLGNIASATGVLRFKATTINNDPTYSSIGIDDVSVTDPALFPLDAEFATTVTSGAAPLSVSFKDMSDGLPTSWKWDFNNDGVIDATSQNPSYTYSKPGSYTVRQIISKNGSSVEEVKVKYITVTGYAPLPFSETFDSTWISRDGNRDVPSPFCKNSPAYIYLAWSRDDDGVDRGSWYSDEYAYFPSGANGSAHSARNKHSGTNSLDFYVDCSTMTGDKILTFWYINPAIGHIDIYLSTDGGVTFGNSLFTQSYVSSWKKFTYNLGNITSPTCVIRFKETTNEGGYIGKDMGLDEIGINSINANFSADKLIGAYPLTVKFSDLSEGSPTNWKWDFNNDGVYDSYIQNPSYTFSQAGNYTVRLAASKTGNTGYSTKTEYIKVIEPIHANFSVDITSGMAPLKVKFTDLSTGNPTSWNWDFNGDGIIDSTSQNPSFTYQYAGKYAVKLIALKTGTSDTITKVEYISISPKTYVTLPFKEDFEEQWINDLGTRDIPSLGWQNNPHTGNNSWSRDEDGINRGAWTNLSGAYSPVGANGSSHSARFHSYATNSTNNFDLYVNFSSLAGDKLLYFWYINPHGTDKLEVFLSTDGGSTFGNALQTLTTSSDWTKNIINLGSSISSTCVLRFKATGDRGMSDIGIDEVKINAVEAAFIANPTTGTTPLTVNFTDQSSGNPTSWKWDFNNDGVIDSTTQNPSFKFDKAGVYTVSLISSKLGSTDTVTKLSYIRVEDPFDAIFTADKTSGIAPLTVKFTDQSTGNPTSWAWDFNNDGITDSYTKNPSFIFTSSGTYTVRLVITKAGFSDTEIKTSYIVVSTSTDVNSINLPEKNINVYPNPANNWAKVELKNIGNKKVKLELVNSQGATISTINLKDKKTHEFDFSDLPRGVYYLKTYYGDKVFINKLILQ